MLGMEVWSDLQTGIEVLNNENLFVLIHIATILANPL